MYTEYKLRVDKSILKMFDELFLKQNKGEFLLEKNWQYTFFLNKFKVNDHNDQLFSCTLTI